MVASVLILHKMCISLCIRYRVMHRFPQGTGKIHSASGVPLFDGGNPQEWQTGANSYSGGEKTNTRLLHNT
jgi:hypothetical protein